MLNWLMGKQATAEMSAADLLQRLAGPDAPFLLDVREPSEYAVGHVAGAVLIPLGQLAARLGEVPADREIAVICRSGARSQRGTELLQAQGRRALNVAGGMMAWRGPVARGA